MVSRENKIFQPFCELGQDCLVSNELDRASIGVNNAADCVDLACVLLMGSSTTQNLLRDLGCPVAAELHREAKESQPAVEGKNA